MPRLVGSVRTLRGRRARACRDGGIWVNAGILCPYRAQAIIRGRCAQFGRRVVPRESRCVRFFRANSIGGMV